jgi:hypothetical protein
MPTVKVEKTKESRGSIDIENTVNSLIELSKKDVNKRILILLVEAIASYKEEGRKPDTTYIKLIQMLKDISVDNKGGLSNEEFEDMYIRRRYKTPE